MTPMFTSRLTTMRFAAVSIAACAIACADNASAANFIAAAPPAKASAPSPLTPNQQQAAFTVPPGFEIELVAAESAGIGKFVAVDWDIRGRMWSMTAFEYPVD